MKIGIIVYAAEIMEHEQEIRKEMENSIVNPDMWIAVAHQILNNEKIVRDHPFYQIFCDQGLDWFVKKLRDDSKYDVTPIMRQLVMEGKI